MLVTVKQRTSNVGELPSTQVQHVEEGYFSNSCGVSYDPDTNSYGHKVVSNFYSNPARRFVWPEELNKWLR